MPMQMITSCNIAAITGPANLRSNRIAMYNTTKKSEKRIATMADLAI